MDMVKTLFRLGFASVFRPWLDLRDLLRAARGEPSIEIQTAPLEIDQPDKKLRVVLQVRALTIGQEDPRVMDEGVGQLIVLLEKLNTASPFPAVRQMRYDAFFIEPYSLPFHELVVVMKKQLLRPSPLVNIATDVGLMLDQHEGEVLRHIQVGPMQAEQLRSMFLKWPREQLPDQFVFLALGYERNRETNFAVPDVRDFLESAIGWQTRHAQAVLALLRGEEG